MIFSGMSPPQTMTTRAVEVRFDGMFVGLGVACALLQLAARAPSRSTNKKPTATDAATRALYWRYLPVWLCFKAADWLQGPYFHELYSTKVIDGEPISQDAVGHLFLAGFISSAAFSATLAPRVDRAGRKLGCLGFVALYVLAALSTYSNYWPTLLAGRVCSGAATSLLFSAPESWMVRRAHTRQLRARRLYRRRRNR